jgi:anti-sigma factor RsiW
MSQTDPHHIACREVVELVTEYLEGTLSPEQVERFELHLGLCDPCVTYIRTAKKTIELTRASAKPVAENVKQQLLAALARQKRT